MVWLLLLFLKASVLTVSSIVLPGVLLIMILAADAPPQVVVDGSTNPSSSGNWLTVASVVTGKLRAPSEGAKVLESGNLLAVNVWSMVGTRLN